MNRKLTLRQMYDFIFGGCKSFKEQNSKSIDRDYINRSCNKYAVKNTTKCWRAQFNEHE